MEMEMVEKVLNELLEYYLKELKYAEERNSSFTVVLYSGKVDSIRQVGRELFG